MVAAPHNLRPRYNVCPTDPVDVVTAEEGKRELAAADRCWALGRMERPRDRRATKVLHDDHHRAQRVRCRSSRPYAGVVDRRPVHAMAQRRGGKENAEAGVE
jgi:hypothetical protein